MVSSSLDITCRYSPKISSFSTIPCTNLYRLSDPAIHIEAYENLYDTLPEAVVADAGYGSDENYGILQKKSVEAISNTTPLIKSRKKVSKHLVTTACITTKRRTTRCARWDSGWHLSASVKDYNILGMCR